jgi:Alcohol dehydrogenase GroES-like domain
MKALVYTQPNEVQLLDRPMPQAADGEVVLQIEAVGICASDMHAWHGRDPRRQPGLVLGHEFVGRITQSAAPGFAAALLQKHLGASALTVAELNARRRDALAQAVGSAGTRKQAFASVTAGGVIMHVGLQDWSSEIDMRRLTLAEITLLGTYTYTTADLQATADALHRGVFGNLAWVEERPIEQGRRRLSIWIRGARRRPRSCFGLEVVAGGLMCRAAPTPLTSDEWHVAQTQAFQPALHRQWGARTSGVGRGIRRSRGYSIRVWSNMGCSPPLHDGLPNASTAQGRQTERRPARPGGPGREVPRACGASHCSDVFHVSPKPRHVGTLGDSTGLASGHWELQ